MRAALTKFVVRRLKLAYFLVQVIYHLMWRRQDWLFENLTCRKFANLLVAGTQFVLKSERLRAWPMIAKVDISPLCNLRCTTCVHAMPSETSNDELKSQHFHGRQFMTVDQFQKIVDELAGKTLSIGMYYVGDPLVHPDLDEMCGRAWKAGLNTHVSTNFSFQLSDERIRSIVESGLTHLTVCVDGLHQETYELTRVGGQIARVLDNLERVLKVRRELGRKWPKVEVQYIKFQHNIGDLAEAERRLTALGIDRFTHFWGQLNNYTDFVPGKFQVRAPKKNSLLPQCYWPYFSLQIKYNGDVVPCCNFRQGLQYTDSDEQRIVGNVFTHSIWDVWNSPEYQRMRRFVANPERVKQEAALKATFCDGCPALFQTDVQSTSKLGSDHKWEDLYELDERKHVVRKPETEQHAIPDTVYQLQILCAIPGETTEEGSGTSEFRNWPD